MGETQANEHIRNLIVIDIFAVKDKCLKKERERVKHRHTHSESNFLFMMMIYSITVFKQEREKLKKEFINLRQADIVANIYSPSQPPPPQFRPFVHAKFSHHWTRNRKLTFCQHVILSHYFHTHLFGPPSPPRFLDPSPPVLQSTTIIIDRSESWK